MYVKKIKQNLTSEEQPNFVHRLAKTVYDGHALFNLCQLVRRSYLHYLNSIIAHVHSHLKTPEIATQK